MSSELRKIIIPVEFWKLHAMEKETLYKLLCKVFHSAIVIGENSHYWLKGKDSIYIEAWHGMPIKGVLLSDKNRYPHAAFSVAVQMFEKVDYILSLSQFYSLVLNACFGQHVIKYIITGYPRNDWLFHCNKVTIEKILSHKVKHDLEYEHIIIYLPTFRKSSIAGSSGSFQNIINVDHFNLQTFESFLKASKILLVVKLHPLEESEISEDLEGFSNMLFIDDSFLIQQRIHLYEILACSDILITDYSSVYFDFLITGKPIIFAVGDIDIYRNERGFILEPYQFWMPGPKVKTQNQLLDEILKLLEGDDNYMQQRNDISKIIHNYRDPHSSKRLEDFVWKILKVLN